MGQVPVVVSQVLSSDAEGQVSTTDVDPSSTKIMRQAKTCHCLLCNQSLPKRLGRGKA